MKTDITIKHYDKNTNIEESDFEVQDIRGILLQEKMDNDIYVLETYTSRLNPEALDEAVIDITKKDKDAIILVRTYISKEDYPDDKYYAVVNGDTSYGAVGNKEPLDINTLLMKCNNEILEHNVISANVLVNVNDLCQLTFSDIYIALTNDASRKVHDKIKEMTEKDEQ